MSFPRPAWLTANRIAAATVFISGLAAFLAGIIGVFPHSWQNLILAAVGLLTKLATGLKFLTGSQKWDALISAQETDTANAASALDSVPPPPPLDVPADVPAGEPAPTTLAAPDATDPAVPTAPAAPAAPAP